MLSQCGTLPVVCLTFLSWGWDAQETVGKEGTEKDLALLGERFLARSTLLSVFSSSGSVA